MPCNYGINTSQGACSIHWPKRTAIREIEDTIEEEGGCGEIRETYFGLLKDCYDPNMSIDKYETKKAKKVKIKEKLDLGSDVALMLRPQIMFSIHKQNSNEYKHEIYD